MRNAFGRNAALIALCALLAFAPVSALGASPAQAFGDLKHLTFTAVGPLLVSFVDPANNAAASINAVAVTASTGKGAGVELTVNGTLVSSSLLGKRTVADRTGETQYFFYGVPLKAGPNTLQLVALGADGARGIAVKRTVFGPGAPSSIRADFAERMVADGTTAVSLRIWVTDQYQHAAEAGARMTVRVLSGPARLGSAGGASAATGQSQPTDFTLPPGGYVQVPIIPGVTAGTVEIEIAAGDARYVEHFFVDPYLRKPFVNGLISAGRGVVPNSIDGNGNFNNGDSTKARIALFGTGRLGKRSALTFAYESQNTLTDLSSVGSFTANPNERPYQTYGDASTLENPLQSRSRIYARLDNGRNSLMWGLFTADIHAGDAGGYHQLLNGAKVELAGGNGARVNATAFAARNDTAFVSQSLPALGLASLERPLFPNIVVGSDFLQLVALDRNSGVVVSQVPLVRNVDYTIDYATGVLRFINIPLPYDQNFNPQVVLLQYQYQGAAVQSQTTGASLHYELGRDRGTALDLGYVNDATGSQNYALASQQFVRTWNSGSMSISHATSKGFLPGPGTVSGAAAGGNALTFSFKSHGALDRFEATVQDTTAGFSNPFGGLNTPGLLAYRTSYTHSVLKRYALTLGADGQTNHGTASGTSTQTNAAAALQWTPNQRLSFTAGLTRHAQTIGSAPALVSASPQPAVALQSQSQLQAVAGIDYRPAKRLALSLQTSRTISGSDQSSSQPSQTQAQATFTIDKNGRAYVRELWSAQPTSTFANATNAITSGTGSSHALQFGMERDVSPAMTVTTDYLVSGTGSAKNIFTTIGVQEKLKFGKNLAGNLTAQRAQASGTGAGGFMLWGGSLAYAQGDRLRATASYQGRTGDQSGATFSVGVAGHLTSNISIVGAVQHAYGGSSGAVNDNLTMAYRSAYNDRFTSLLSYTRSNGLTASGYASNVASFEELYHPTERLEIAGRYAYKLDGDGYYLAHTVLSALRIRQDIGNRFDIGGEVRGVNIPSARNARLIDFATEAGMSIGSSARAALGYDFSGSIDPTLTGRPQRRGVYITVSSLIDSVFGWGKAQAPKAMTATAIPVVTASPPRR